MEMINNWGLFGKPARERKTAGVEGSFHKRGQGAVLGVTHFHPGSTFYLRHFCSPLGPPGPEESRVPPAMGVGHKLGR